MKVARYYAPEDLRIEDAAVPEPGPGELLLKVHNCATCGTDVKIYYHGHHHITRRGCSATRWPARWWRSARAPPASRSATACS